jgi:hypothetical protein
MKKKIAYLLVIFWVISGCTTIPVNQITDSDIDNLKGRWQGRYWASHNTGEVELEIRDNLIGVWRGGPVNISRGKIENGRLVFFSGGDNVVLELSNTKLRFEGTFRVSGVNGTISLEKMR